MHSLSRFVLPAVFVVTLGLLACKEEAQPAAAPAPGPAAPASGPVQIPRIADVTADWAKQAHQVHILNPVDNTPGAKVQLAVAWTPSAFLFQAHTDDATPFETASDPWMGDAVGFTIATSFGSDDDQINFVSTPGRSAAHPEPSWQIKDLRTDPPKLAAPEIHVTHDDKGYTMTVSLPWSDFKHVPQAGDIIAVQVCVNDGQGPNPLSHRTWFPTLANSPQNMQRVQLAERADPPEMAMARIHPKGFNGFAVEVLAVPEAAGKEVAIWSGGKQVASGKLALGGFDGDATADVVLPDEIAKEKDAPLIVAVDGQAVPTEIKVPDLAAVRLGLVKKQPLAAKSSIFDGSAFPKIDFLNRELIEAALGSYSLKIRYFDDKWNEVTAPLTAGRYGALVEVRLEDGSTCEREFTLFKTAQPYDSSKEPYTVSAKFPAAFGLSDELAAREQWNVSNWLGDALEDATDRNEIVAKLASALSDIQADPARCQGFDVWKIDDDWWAELHKRLGADQEYPHLTYLPDGYDKDQKKAWPLILFLHGSGERGNDLKRVQNQGPQGYVHMGHPLPFIIITPECPADEWWTADRLSHLLDEVCAANRVDPKRIYVTGLSMGGYGTWDLAGTYPERFAAIAPDAGGENPGIAERLAHVPTWVFHGSEDTVVPTRYSLDIVHAMQKLGAPVKLTLYPGMGHGGWEMTYDNPELYTWFLQHSR